MKKNDIINVDIVDIGINGEGIAKQDNIVIFIPFALLGENIDAHILKVNKKIAFAKIKQINKPSPTRCNAICPYFTKCGGCEMQHIKYSEQLKIKTQTVKTAFKKYARTSIDVLPCVASDNIFSYRNKMQYPCTPKGIGMYAKNSHNLIDIANCPLSKPLCAKAYEIFREFALKNNLSFYNEHTHSGLVRNAMFREANTNIAICIVINGKKIEQIDKLIELYKKEFKDNFSLYYNINTEKTNTILSNNTICVYGKDKLKMLDFGVTYYISPNSFMQINDQIQNAIYTKVLDNISPNDIIINAYSGAGLLSAILSKKAKTVYGIEIVKVASENADFLKQINKIQNMQNICGDCAIVLPKLIQNLDKTLNTTLVLDPPRKGCEKNIIDAIKSAKINKIIYISCNPATLARDVSFLLDDYNIRLVQPYDMFPQTKHVETVAILEKIRSKKCIQNPLKKL